MTTSSTSNPRPLPDDLRDVKRKLEELGAEGRLAELIDLVVALLVRMRDTNNALALRGMLNMQFQGLFK